MRRLAVGFASLLFSCNSVTGMDGVLFVGEGGAGGAGGNGTGGIPAGGAGGTPLMGSVDAVGVTIDQIVLYQGVERPLMSGGLPANTNVPVVADRDALIRVFVTTDGSYDGTDVYAQLTIDGAAPLEVVKTVSGNSSEGALGSTFNFDVPGSVLQPGSLFHVALVQPFKIGAPAFAGAHYPESGDVSLGVESNGGFVKLTIVPVRYGADGSNRLPDTSATAIANYTAAFMALYPIAELQLDVRNAWTWNQTVSPNGAGWGELLDGIANLRIQDNASFDEYYYGAFAPASSFGQFCNFGCVAGLGFQGSPFDDYTRASIGLGYGDGGAFQTAVHEVGHNHGRDHAPCGGAQGVDPGYPYSGGGIGSWGYNGSGGPVVLEAPNGGDVTVSAGELLAPSGYKDMMGYCQPGWISDYTFSAIFDHVKALNGASLVYPPDSLEKKWEHALVLPDGSLKWLATRTLHRPPLADTVPVSVKRGRKSETIFAHFYTFDHLPGGVLVWREGDVPTSSLTFGQKTIKK